MLQYATIVTDDLDGLCAFYTALLEVPELVEHRAEIYRGIDLGHGVTLALSSPAVYGLLGIPDDAGPTGTRQYLTFRVATDADLEARTARAVTLGAVVVKEPYETAYGSYQSVLRDPEGNVFRLNCPRT